MERSRFRCRWWRCSAKRVKIGTAANLCWWKIFLVRNLAHKSSPPAKVRELCLPLAFALQKAHADFFASQFDTGSATYAAACDTPSASSTTTQNNRALGGVVN